MQQNIATNLANIKVRARSAAERAGRSPSDFSLICVTKQHPVEDIQTLINLGERQIGENRVPEAVEKIEHFAAFPIEPPIEWHFIGHLQTNKVKKIAGRCALIHSVDSLRLAEAVQKACDAADTTADILLELNVSGEESKYGIVPAELGRIAAGLRDFERIRCHGLMTMAPYDAEADFIRKVFRDLRLLREGLREKGLDHLKMEHLSMGMTNDFEIAVEEGATLLRIGTAIFE